MKSIISSIPFCRERLGSAPSRLYKKTDCIEDSEEYKRHREFLNTAKECRQFLEKISQDGFEQKIAPLSQRLRNALFLNIEQMIGSENIKEEVDLIHSICKKYPPFRKQFLMGLKNVESSISHLSKEKKDLVLDACWQFTQR